MNATAFINAARLFSIVLGVILFGVLMWAFGAGQFFQEAEVVWALPWGKQMLADLYGGIIVLSVLILIIERSWFRGLLWCAPLFVLGNVWAAVWLACKLPEIIKRLRPAAS